MRLPQRFTWGWPLTDYAAGFERWWSLYPRHRRKDKVKCFKKWKERNLESRASEVIAKLQADIDFDPQWNPVDGKPFIPLTHTYLNGGRYDDDAPKPRRSGARPGSDDVLIYDHDTQTYFWGKESDRPVEKDPYVASVKRVAVNWLIRGGLKGRAFTEEKAQKALDLIHSLAVDAKELHEAGELTDGYAQTIRDELDALMAR